MPAHKHATAANHYANSHNFSIINLKNIHRENIKYRFYVVSTQIGLNHRTFPQRAVARREKTNKKTKISDTNKKDRKKGRTYIFWRIHSPESYQCHLHKLNVGSSVG